jgi:Ca-activated chloride channel family protein
VVPGDQAAGRVADPVVRTELVYLRAQQAKRRASGHLSKGDSDAALREIRQAQQDIEAARADAPESQVADLAEEAQELEYLARETEYGSQQRSGKYLSASSHRKLQKRGRVMPTRPDGEPPASDNDERRGR